MSDKKYRTYNGGIVATQDIDFGVFLGIAIENQGDSEVMDWNITDLGRGMVDRLDGNVDMVKFGDDYYLQANIDIKRGDQITLDFEQAPDFFITKGNR